MLVIGLVRGEQMLIESSKPVLSHRCLMIQKHEIRETAATGSCHILSIIDTISSSGSGNGHLWAHMSSPKRHFLEHCVVRCSWTNAAIWLIGISHFCLCRETTGDECNGVFCGYMLVNRYAEQWNGRNAHVSE